VNFAVTPEGLEDQLLALVVRKERPELASQKAGLIHQANEFMVKIAELEDGILKGLAEAEGDITEDVALIEGLEESKRVANDIADKLAAGKKTAISINKTSEKYRPVARRGAQLFFIMNELVKIHTYYIYSLNAFVVVFQTGIEKVQHEDKEAESAGKPKGKMSMLKKLKSNVKKIIMTQRFGWNNDILGEAFRASPADLKAADKANKDHHSAPGSDAMANMMGGLMLNMQQKKAAEAAKMCKVGDLCDVEVFGVGKVLEIREDGMYVIEMTDMKMGNGKPALMYCKKDQIEKTIDYKTRCKKLYETITSTTFNYIRRGLFEKDKLTVVSLFALTLQIADKQINKGIVDSMLLNKLKANEAEPTEENPDGGSLVTSAVTDWLPDLNLQQTLGLEDGAISELVPEFATLHESLEANAAEWKEWYNHSAPEGVPCPGALASLDDQARLVFVRAMRPDRATFAMSNYISKTMGQEYVFQNPFDMKTTYQESSASTPMFFVLFPGVDPTPMVEALGKNLGISTEAGTFVNISMGQGQEANAENMLEKMSQKGGWVMLQNVHLMQSWLTKLDRKLEVCAETAHQDFRCFVSGEPPGFAYQSNVPESLLQCCIKVANEAPSDLKSNIVRAFSLYSDEYLEECTKKNEYKACLYTLCFFHSVMVGRIRFGQIGWSRKYSFNTGDLMICSDVCKNYLNDNEVVPWKDLRYIFGEIMYGGHITDFWDRQVDNTYLAVLMQPDIVMSEGVFAPGFTSPNPEGMKFADYITNTKDKLPPEAPPLYGLHPNSEIAYLMGATSDMFGTILRLSAGSGGGDGDAGGGVKDTITTILEGLPALFDLITLDERAEEFLTGPQAPYVLVVKQECGRMNILINTIASTLDELTKGLAGALNMTQPMEDLLTALTIFEVPGRNPYSKASWELVAWPSTKGLMSWYADTQLRVEQLVEWTGTLQLPFSLWIGALFNPTSFLTAIKQVVSRSTGSALDQMSTETHVTTLQQKEDAKGYPQDGAYVHGIYMEGARWNVEGYDETDVSGTSCKGAVAESKPKELYPLMPLIYIKAVQIQSDWDPQAVGYIRPEPHLYNCPVYYTTYRGHVFIFTATLTVDQLDRNRCTLAGVAMLFSLDA
jgi:dynein heavy chain